MSLLRNLLVAALLGVALSAVPACSSNSGSSSTQPSTGCSLFANNSSCDCSTTNGKLAECTVAANGGSCVQTCPSFPCCYKQTSDGTTTCDCTVPTSTLSCATIVSASNATQVSSCP
ncbi:MAG: hypothetical protein ACLQVI_23970 [Polyangiaceae bacterium]